MEGSCQTKAEDFSKARVALDIEAKSINTWVPQRDDHLRSTDFFNVDRFPKISFKSSSMEKIGNDYYELHGDLTILNMTNPITLNVHYHGTVVDMFGMTRAGFSLNGMP